MPVAERRQETESRIAGPFYQGFSDNWPDTGPGCPAVTSRLTRVRWAR